MNRSELLELHKTISERGRNLMVQKNHDYAGADGDDPFANFRASEVLGVGKEILLLCRVLDKIQRLKTFVRSGNLAVQGEGWKDACVDILNYSVLLYGMLLEEEEIAKDAANKAGDGVSRSVGQVRPARQRSHD